jgi:hypothetical protein
MDKNNNNITGAQHPDIEAFLVMHDANNAYIFHEKSFESPLQWIEYDSQTGQLEFILEDGQSINFGKSLSKETRQHFENITSISVANHDGAIVSNEQTVSVIHHGHFPKPEPSDYTPTSQKVLADTYAGVMGTPPFPTLDPLTKEGEKALAQIREYRQAAIPTQTGRKLSSAGQQKQTIA